MYSINRVTGVETVLHSFGSKAKDGVYPLSGVIKFGKKLYGTTEFGGTGGAGTIFEIDPDTGFEKVVYSFRPPGVSPQTDGSSPYGNLIEVNGVLYGTTFQGGPYPSSYGTVFSFNAATKTESILYAFQGGTDGYNPRDGLTEVHGTLFGQTDAGGAAGAGTIYAIAP